MEIPVATGSAVRGFMNIRIQLGKNTQRDSHLPSFALVELAAWNRQTDRVSLRADRDLTYQFINSSINYRL